MLGYVVVLLCLVTAACAYVLGRLSELTKRLKETQTLLAHTHLEMRAYQNQLLVRQGSPPIFKENGAINLSRVPDETPIMQIMRPPFAQAELDWEDEENEKKVTLKSFLPTPPLTDADKERIRTSMNGGNHATGT